MSWRTLATLALLAGALLTGWFLWSQRDRDAAPATGTTQPDYILNDFELIALDAQGRESFTLRAPRLERNPNDKTLDIRTPLFIIPSAEEDKGSPWEVRAATGWVSERGDRIRLRGKVRAESRDADGRPLTMQTEQLNVFPEKKRARSPVKVTLTQPGVIMNGRNLDANLERNRINLKDTHTRYERTAR